MPQAASSPSISHSPAYYHSPTNIIATPFEVYGVPLSHVQPPPSVHHHHQQQQQSLPPVPAITASQRSSEWGRLSKPAGAFETYVSDMGKYSPQSTSRHTISSSSNAEQGSINHGLSRSEKRHSGRYDTTPNQRLSWPGRNTAEYSGTTYAYAPEGGCVDKSTDHAVLVLVSPTHLTSVSSIDVPYSCGLRAWIRSTRFSVLCTPCSPSLHCSSLHRSGFVDLLLLKPQLFESWPRSFRYISV